MCSLAYWFTYDKDLAKVIVPDSWEIIIKKLPYSIKPNSFGSWVMQMDENDILH